MKRSAIIYVFIITLFSTACNKEEEQLRIDDNKISFSSSDVEITKAVSTFGPITLAALQASADGYAVSTNSLPYGNMNNVNVKYTGGQWTYTGSYYWPINRTQNVSFTAYAPAGTTGVTLTSTGMTVAGFTPATDITKQIDLLYASPTNFNRSGAGSGVALTFNHMLTQIVFSVTTVLSGVVMLKSIEFTVPNPTGAYNGSTWSNSGTTVTYTIPVNTQVLVGAVVTTPVLMVPKGTVPNGTSMKVNYSVLVDLSITKQLNSTVSNIKSWQPGYKITYNSILGLTRSGELKMDVVATEERRID